MNLKHEVISDGKTVWVNGPHGDCLGRFSWAGVDIHNGFHAQIETGKQCLNCIKGPTTRDHWEIFKVEIKKHYLIEVTDEHMPTFLRKAS